jgi:hypothetical protein
LAKLAPLLEEIASIAEAYSGPSPSTKQPIPESAQPFAFDEQQERRRL